MFNKYMAMAAIAALTITLILIYIQFIDDTEQFATKKDKAQTIVDWFAANANHSYTNYKRDLNNQSNIVEYEDAMSLFQNKNLTVDSVTSVI